MLTACDIFVSKIVPVIKWNCGNVLVQLFARHCRLGNCHFLLKIKFNCCAVETKHQFAVKAYTQFKRNSSTCYSTFSIARPTLYALGLFLLKVISYNATKLLHRITKSQ